MSDTLILESYDELRKSNDALRNRVDALAEALCEFIQYAEDVGEDSPELDKAKRVLKGQYDA